MAKSVKRWCKHSDHFINTLGLYSQTTIESFPSYDNHDELVIAPIMDEVQTALCHIAGNRAGGSSGILPEMVKVCSNDLLWYVFCEVLYQCLG